MHLQTFSIVEGGEEILTVPRLPLAALAWMENPETRKVYRIVPSGAAAWEQVGEVPESELRAALPDRLIGREFDEILILKKC